ncbi:MAG TPA: sensor domain-containing diguanylate cyclase [Thermodesulfovibrionales bacterium]|nr:sensor domain-containing diguanylate cyclase [Thermodesulfovibrionales bacterium]
MPDVFIIGRELVGRDFPSLTKYGRLVKLKSINDVHARSDDGVAFVIVEKSQCKEQYFREFSKKFFTVPKLVVSSDHSFRGFGPWLRHPLTFPVHTHDEKALSFLAGRLASERSTRLDILRLREELSIAKFEIGLSGEIGRVLSSDIEMDEMLLLIMKSIKKAVGASSWSVFLIDEETGDLVLKRTNDRKKGQENLRIKPGEGIAGWVLREGIAAIVPDVSRDERCRRKGSGKTTTGTSSLVCVPIKSNEKTIGAIELMSASTGKPFTRDDLALLARIVDYAAVAIKVASLYQKMAELSVTDDLTKLFNSRYLNRTIEVELQRSERSRTSVSLIFMDIDYFKQVNDEFGHLTGSKLLVEVGQLLLKNLRSIDIVARYGGDEFVIVLPQTPSAVASRVAQRIRKSVEQNVFMKKEGCQIKITASFGVASYPESAKTKEELLRLADEAMYRVKNQTRNGVYAII